MRMSTRLQGGRGGRVLGGGRGGGGAHAPKLLRPWAGAEHCIGACEHKASATRSLARPGRASGRSRVAKRQDAVHLRRGDVASGDVGSDAARVLQAHHRQAGVGVQHSHRGGLHGSGPSRQDWRRCVLKILQVAN